jgi:hypothetical protein
MDGSSGGGETEAQRRERQKHEAILEALADERVVDEESFQRAVRARERRNREDEEAEKKRQQSPPSDADGNPVSPQPTPPKRWAQDDGREYPISTERAEAISRWVRDAPPVGESNGTKNKKRTKGKGKKPSLRAGGTGLSLAESVDTLSVQEEDIDE